MNWGRQNGRRRRSLLLFLLLFPCCSSSCTQPCVVCCQSPDAQVTPSTSNLLLCLAEVLGPYPVSHSVPVPSNVFQTIPAAVSKLMPDTENTLCYKQKRDVDPATPPTAVCRNQRRLALLLFLHNIAPHATQQIPYRHTTLLNLTYSHTYTSDRCATTTGATTNQHVVQMFLKWARLVKSSPQNLCSACCWLTASSVLAVVSCGAPTDTITGSSNTN